MKTELDLVGTPLRDIPAKAKRAEGVGFSGVVSTEMAHEPFMPLALAAEHTRHITVATGVAIAFARSPVVTAYSAWDLQNLSQGRLLLGLGTQVKGHNERRFSVPWGPPGPRLREYILALRAIWDCWQSGTKLDFRGDHYTHTLMPPNANPGPIEHPQIPIHISAVNPYMCRLAGELCDGIRLHPLASPQYTRDKVLPNVAVGLAKAGRSLSSVDICGTPLVATGENEEELARGIAGARRTISFYGSTRTYHAMFEHHGWADKMAKLHAMSEQGQWAAMPAEIDDEMVGTMAIVATWDKLAARIKEFCGGTWTRLTFRLLPTATPADDEHFRDVIAALGD